MSLFIRILFAFTLFLSSLEAFDKVVIWGHKLHSHTHSYIHFAFYRAFEHLGYKTYWFDDQDDVSEFDFANSLFLTEGQVDKNIPLRTDCQYILHYCRSPKYRELIETGNCLILQVYNTHLYIFDEAGNPILESAPDPNALVNLEPCVYFDPIGKRVYMPWGTDLLPHEIEEVKQNIDQIKKERLIYWVGTYAGGFFGNKNEVDPFIKACKANHVFFVHKNPWIAGISMEKNCELIKKSYMAPAIVGTWQNKNGYIPCRIFKNISYGQLGVTNSKTVYDLFEGKIVYNPDTYQLFFDAEQRLKSMTQDDLFELMDFVKNRHTYINRIQVLLECLEAIK